MRRLLVPAVLLLLCSFTLTGDYAEVIAHITGTELPQISKPNKELVFKITAEFNDHSTKYSRQETNVKGKVVTVTLYGEYPKNGECQKGVQEFTINYSYTPKSAGKYIFHFVTGIQNGVKQFMSDTLLVK
ncbi:MAG: hypothetical protein AB1458_01575 [Bacteroidota bacterium]